METSFIWGGTGDCSIFLGFLELRDDKASGGTGLGLIAAQQSTRTNSGEFNDLFALERERFVQRFFQGSE